MLYVVARYNIQQFYSVPRSHMAPLFLARPPSCSIVIFGEAGHCLRSDDCGRLSIDSWGAASCQAIFRPSFWRSTFPWCWIWVVPIAVSIDVLASLASCQPVWPIIGMLRRLPIR